MGTHVRPFRVAFRTLLVAFGLSLLVTASHPRSARLAILAKSHPDTSRLNHSPVVSIANSGSSLTDKKRRPTSGSVGPSLPTAPQPTLADEPRDWQEITAGRRKSAVEEEQWPDGADDLSGPAVVSDGTLETHRISSGVDRSENPKTSVSLNRGGTMPVISPTNLQSSRSRGEYFELPPPPEGDRFSAPLSSHLDTSPFHAATLRDEVPGRERVDRLEADADSPQHVQQRLEAEIVSLRREIDRLADAQKLGLQLDRLEREQQELLRLHQELPLERMLQLLDLLMVQLQTVRETIPSRPGPVGPACPECSSLEGEVSQPAGGRISLRITEAQLEDVLRMFSTLSGKSIVIDSHGEQNNSTGDEVHFTKQNSPEYAESFASAPELPPLIQAIPPASRPLNELADRIELGQSSLRSAESSSRCATCHPNHVAR